MKIILDANVIIAAFAARGLCSAVFELCLDRFEIVLSEEILKETFTNLNRKIKLSAEQCEKIIYYLKGHVTVSDVDNVDKSACRDVNDLHVLGLAQCSQADYMVTGDQDLLDLIRHNNTKIVLPREFWQVVKNQFH